MSMTRSQRTAVIEAADGVGVGLRIDASGQRDCVAGKSRALLAARRVLVMMSWRETGGVFGPMCCDRPDGGGFAKPREPRRSPPAWRGNDDRSMVPGSRK